MKDPNKIFFIVIVTIAIIIVIGFVTSLVFYANSNVNIFDTHYTFNYAILQWSDGEEVIPITSWSDYENSDQLQFTSVDGITYLVHSSDVFLVSDWEE